jgi:hypothetical protein
VHPITAFSLYGWGRLRTGRTYLLAFVALVGPPGWPDALAPWPGGLRGADSLGRSYAVEYTEVARRRGLTIAAVAPRDPRLGLTAGEGAARRIGQCSVEARREP